MWSVFASSNLGKRYTLFDLYVMRFENTFFAGPGLRQWIMNTAITGNEGGGFSFQNVGELNPTVLIEGCRIQNCGLKMLNMTSPGIIDMYIQASIDIQTNFTLYFIVKCTKIVLQV